MNDPLNILLVDDNPDDRALAMRAIDREFPNCQFHQVGTPHDFSRAIDARPWDIVLTDYQLRWSDGIAIVRSIKNRLPSCPVIMLTGSGSEEVAVQAMKAGVDDYVLKSSSRNSRLPAAVHMALERAKRDRESARARQDFRSFFDDVPLGLFRAGPDGQITDANPALMKLLHCSSHDMLLSTNLLALFADARKGREMQTMLGSTGVVQHFDAMVCCCDGRTRWVEMNARAIPAGHDQQAIYEGSMVDVSARKVSEKQLRETREQLRALAGVILRETEPPTAAETRTQKYPRAKRVGHRLILQET